MNTDIKEIVEILSAALAPITAVVALGIAYRQYRLERVNRHSLLTELELFFIGQL